jgi:hypothetical protein
MRAARGPGNYAVAGSVMALKDAFLIVDVEFERR